MRVFKVKKKKYRFYDIYCMYNNIEYISKILY